MYCLASSIPVHNALSILQLFCHVLPDPRAAAERCCRPMGPLQANTDFRTMILVKQIAHCAQGRPARNLRVPGLGMPEGDPWHFA